MKFKIFKYDSVNSKNDIAIEIIKKKKYENGFVYALTQKKGTGPVPLSLQLEELVAFQGLNDTGQDNPWQSNHRSKLRLERSIEFP